MELLEGGAEGGGAAAGRGGGEHGGGEGSPRGSTGSVSEDATSPSPSTLARAPTASHLHALKGKMVRGLSKGGGALSRLLVRAKTGLSLGPAQDLGEGEGGDQDLEGDSSSKGSKGSKGGGSKGGRGSARSPPAAAAAPGTPHTATPATPAPQAGADRTHHTPTSTPTHSRKLSTTASSPHSHHTATDHAHAHASPSSRLHLTDRHHLLIGWALLALCGLLPLALLVGWWGRGDSRVFTPSSHPHPHQAAHSVLQGAHPPYRAPPLLPGGCDWVGDAACADAVQARVQAVLAAARELAAAVVPPYVPHTGRQRA